MSPRRRLLVVIAALAALPLLAGCIPSDRGEVNEVGDTSENDRAGGTAPEFPSNGVVDDDLLVRGIVFDLTDRPDDLDYWVPGDDEANCAASAIVERVGGDRLSELGYRPGSTGASLNDIGLSDAELETVTDAFVECVDLAEGVAAMLYGDGRMPTKVAECVADGLDAAGALRPFAVAWVRGSAVDPFADSSALASALIGGSRVCIPETAFNWPDVRLPEDDPVLDADKPGGTGGSAKVDDNTTSTTVAASGSNPPPG